MSKSRNLQKFRGIRYGCRLVTGAGLVDTNDGVVNAVITILQGPQGGWKDVPHRGATRRERLVTTAYQGECGLWICAWVRGQQGGRFTLAPQLHVHC